MLSNRRLTADADADAEAGFGLVEIVVSMLVLAALALAFLPLLIQGLQLSARNATLATGIQLVNDRLQAAQTSSPDCDGVAAIAGTTTFTDPRDVAITVTTTVDACPAAPFVGTVRVSSTAVRTDTGEQLAGADTLVYVNIS
jgi:type II secretory pathway pseudopilin PulG